MINRILKNKRINDLQYRTEELKAELFALRFQSATGKLEKSHRIKELRREVARILTHLQMRKNDGEVIKPLNYQKVVIYKTLKKEIDQKNKIIDKKAKPKFKEKKVIVKEENQINELIELENKNLMVKEIKKVKDITAPVIKEKKDLKQIIIKNSKEVSIKPAKGIKHKAKIIEYNTKTDKERADNDRKK